MTKSFIVTQVSWISVPSQNPNNGAGWAITMDVPNTGGALPGLDECRKSLEWISGGVVMSLSIEPADSIYVLQRPDKGEGVSELQIDDVLLAIPLTVEGVSSLVRMARGGLDETTISLVTRDENAAHQAAQKMLRPRKVA